MQLAAMQAFLPLPFRAFADAAVACGRDKVFAATTIDHPGADKVSIRNNIPSGCFILP